MAEGITAAGLEINDLSTLISELTDSLKTIYGEDITVTSNSPDGQMINIYCQGAIDLRELLVEVNNSFDPDYAAGTVLDQRVAINNIKRRAGSFTIVPVDVVVSQEVTLQGLDSAADDIAGVGFTRADDAGNQYILLSTHTFEVGTTRVNFRAQQLGSVLVSLNSITNAVTVVQGVVSTNNPIFPLQVGEDEETDIQLRVRREFSTQVKGQSIVGALKSKLLNISNVVDCKCLENSTNQTNADNLPPHSLWIIVDGGNDNDIATTIFEDKTVGATLIGSEEVDIAHDNGEIITIKYDRPLDKNFYLRFELKKYDENVYFDLDVLKSAIVNNFSTTIANFVETSYLTKVILDSISQNYGGGGVPINIEVSKNGTDWVDFLTIDTKQEKYKLDTTRITIVEV